MKRSKTVAALLLGGALPLMVACDDAPTEVAASAYPDVAACEADNNPADECRASVEQAQTEHMKNAPRFSSVEECEREMGPGACTVVQSNSGGSVFMPAMMGFMLGRSLGSAFATPVYFDRNGFARSGTSVMGRMQRQEVRRDDDRSGGSAGGARYYYHGSRVTPPASALASGSSSGRSAGFGSTGARSGFSGS